MKKPHSDVQALTRLTIIRCFAGREIKVFLDSFPSGSGSTTSLGLGIDVRGLNNARGQSCLPLVGVLK